MLENLRSFAQPYGGDLFLLLIALALISFGILLSIRQRLPVDQLRRVIRVAALVLRLCHAGRQRLLRHRRRTVGLGHVGRYLLRKTNWPQALTNQAPEAIFLKALSLS